MFDFKAPIAANSSAIRKICNAEVGHLALSASSHELIRDSLSILEEIGRFFGKKPEAIRNWIENHDLPALPTPSGDWKSCSHTIDYWLMCRREKQRKERDD